MEPDDTGALRERAVVGICRGRKLSLLTLLECLGRLCCLLLRLGDGVGSWCNAADMRRRALTYGELESDCGRGEGEGVLGESIARDVG